MELTTERLALMFEYLDELRASGKANMFGARPYLIQMFPEHKASVGRILSAWMKFFSLDKSPDVRASEAIGELT